MVCCSLEGRWFHWWHQLAKCLKNRYVIIRKTLSGESRATNSQDTKKWLSKNGRKFTTAFRRWIFSTPIKRRCSGRCWRTRRWTWRGLPVMGVIWAKCAFQFCLQWTWMVLVSCGRFLSARASCCAASRNRRASRSDTLLIKKRVYDTGPFLRVNPRLWMPNWRRQIATFVFL